MFVNLNFFLVYIALAIFTRSPSAYHALKSLNILQLPCEKTLKGYMYKHSSAPGINEDALCESEKRYEEFKDERKKNGFKEPVGEGVLMWDEVKVYDNLPVNLIFYQVILLFTGPVKSHMEQ